jgi:uncharacterized protein (TIGR02145 family)
MQTSSRPVSCALAFLLGALALLVFATTATAAPFEIEGVIKEVRTIATKEPYRFDDKPVVAVVIVGHRYGKDFDYQYMVVEGETVLEGIAFPELKTGRYVRIKARAEPPGMVGKPINEIRASRYGLCNFSLHVDTVATPRNLTAIITEVKTFAPGEIVLSVRPADSATTSPYRDFKYLVLEGKTTLHGGTLADLKVGATIDLAEASINVPVPQSKDHGKLHGADLFAPVVTLASSTSAISAPAPSALAAAAETVTDIDGNIYTTVKIGDQVWTVENLKTTRFNDGSPISEVSDSNAWKELNTPALCHYENKPEHSKSYGPLYNWYAASSPKIAPPGWRVPTIAEQLALRDYLITHGFNYDGTKEGNKVAKALSTTTEWPYRKLDAYGKPAPDLIGMVGNDPATNNRSGFSARPTGCRWSDGSFHVGDTSVYWWSVTPHEGDHGRHTSLHTWFASFGDNHHHKRTGFSIRLIRDTSAL